MYFVFILQPTASSLFPPPPLFKDIPKMGTVDSPFYRTGLGSVPTYPGYGAGLLHPSGLGTPFVPPNHVTSFAPKVIFVLSFFIQDQCPYQ